MFGGGKGVGLLTKDWVWWPRIGFVDQGLGLVATEDSVLWPKVGFVGKELGLVAKD